MDFKPEDRFMPVKPFVVAVALFGAGLLLPQGICAAELQLEDAYVTLNKEIEVPARGSGVIATLRIRKGVYVRKDDVLGMLDETQAKAQVEFAMAQLESARFQATNDIPVQVAVAGYGVAKSDLEAAEAANRQKVGAFSPADIRQLEFSKERARLTIDQRRMEMKIAAFDMQTRGAQLKIEQDNLSRREIIAPMEGVVEDIAREAGEYVREGDTIVRIVQMDHLKIGGYLNHQRHGRRPLVDRVARLTLDVGNQRKVTLVGKVIYVSSLIKAGGDYKVECEFENVYENGMWLMQPGQPAEVTISDELAETPVNR
jgi:multidrug resistance efflux pump